MQTYVDLSLEWDGDLALMESNDLLLVQTGTGMVKQRIQRIIFTNPGDYEYHPTYGVGAGAYVGDDVREDSKFLASVVDYQLLSDPNVKNIQVTEGADPETGIVAILVEYDDAFTGQPQQFTLPTS